MVRKQPMAAGAADLEDTATRGWTTACEESMRCGCPVSFVGRKLYMHTLEATRRLRAPQIAIPRKRSSAHPSAHLHSLTALCRCPSAGARGEPGED